MTRTAGKRATARKRSGTKIAAVHRGTKTGTVAKPSVATASGSRKRRSVRKKIGIRDRLGQLTYRAACRLMGDDDGEAGRQHLTVTLPDRQSLDNLADSLARLLVASETKQ